MSGTLSRRSGSLPSGRDRSSLPRMRLTPSFALWAVLAAAWMVAGSTASAQSPSTLTGTATAFRVVSGSAPFASSGYFILAPSNQNSSYRIFGITGALSSTGTYSWSKSASTTGLLRLFDDTALGDVTGTFTQSLPTTGDAVLFENVSGPASQLSGYTFSNVPAPTVLDGRTFFCTISDGAAPLAEDGTYRIDFTSPTEYTVTGQTGAAFDSSGTYVFSRPNTCLGRADLTDSVSGADGFFMGFTSSSAGWIAVSNALGGYQICSFTTVNRPFSVSASKGSSLTSIDLTWVPQAGSSSYNIYRKLSGAVQPPVLLASSTGTTYSDRTATPGQQYVYTICSVSPAGLSQMSTASTASTGWRNVAPPASLSATDGTLTASVQLTWPLVTYATSYNVYRSQPGSGYALIGNSAVNSYLDATAAIGTLYTYKVVSVTVGESLTGVTDTGWRNAAAPLNLAATDGTISSCVSVTWTPSTGANGYKVYRGLSATKLTLLGISRTNAFNDQSAVAGKVYTYAVRATTLSGDSALSATDTGYRAVGTGGGGVIRPQTGLLALLPAASEDVDPSLANLSTPIDARDPARQWACDRATRDEWAAAIEAGSRDLDRNGEPDLCQHARGDLDLSGSVDGADVGVLLSVFGESAPALGDLDGDGTVDADDLRALLTLMSGARAR